MNHLREIRFDAPPRLAVAMKAVAFVLASAARGSTHTIAEGPLRGRTIAAGASWASLSTLARWSGLRDERAARAALRRLEALGVVAIERPAGKPMIIAFDDARLASLVSTPPTQAPLSLKDPSRSTQETPPVQRKTPLPLAVPRRGVVKKSSEGETSFALALTGESGVKSEAQQSEETATKEKTAELVDASLPGSTSAAPRGTRARAAKTSPPPPGHGDVVAVWFAEHERARRVKPTFAAREGKLVAQLIERIGVDEAKSVVVRAFADPFWASKITLSKLVSDPDLFRGNGATHATARQGAAPRELAERWERDALTRGA